MFFLKFWKMGWIQFADFIDLDPDPYWSNFVELGTINPDPHHCYLPTINHLYCSGRGPGWSLKPVNWSWFKITTSFPPTGGFSIKFLRNHFLFMFSGSQGLKVSRSQDLKASRPQGLKVSRSQGPNVQRSQSPKVPMSKAPNVQRSQCPKALMSKGPNVQRS